MTSVGNKHLGDGTYRVTPQRNRALFDQTERPSEKITVTILLKAPISALLQGLNKDLAKDGMKAQADGSDKHTIMVKGIPPENGYGAQNILTVVRNHDREAEIIPARS